jgi:hypothetical protein
MLNTTRLFAQILALAYWFFMPCGVFQLALIASLYQLRKAPSESVHRGWLQNLTSVLLAITRIHHLPIWEIVVGALGKVNKLYR